MLNTKSMYKPLVGNTTISQYYYDNRWTPETAETAKFLKLRNIEVYYNLPKAWLSKTGSISAAKIYVKGNDLFCLDHMAVSDPESYGATNPLNRSVVAGLSVTF